MSETVCIGLGGNVGDVEAAMVAALGMLGENSQVKVTARSGLYQTPPWGDEDQDWFLNACAMIETTLEPEPLLDLLKSVEQRLKRQKTRRWGPRTIDLDILVFGARRVSTERLEIPHPRMLDRAFVLLPLNDLAPQLELQGHTIAQWLAKLDTGAIRKFRSAEEWSGER